MTCTYEQAQNEILQALSDAWSTKTTAIVGYIPHVEWPGIDTGTIPDSAKFWARISTQQVSSSQGTLCENVVTNGSKRFTSSGLIYVQMFAPKDNTSLGLLQKLDMLVQSVLRHSTDNVILRNTRVKELTNDDGTLNHNVIAEYQFDEIGG